MIFIKSKATINFTMNTSKLKKNVKPSNFFNQKEASLNKKWPNILINTSRLLREMKKILKRDFFNWPRHTLIELKILSQIWWLRSKRSRQFLSITHNLLIKIIQWGLKCQLMRTCMVECLTPYNHMTWWTTRSIKIWKLYLMQWEKLLDTIRTSKVWLNNHWVRQIICYKKIQLISEEWLLITQMQLTTSSHSEMSSLTQWKVSLHLPMWVLIMEIK